MLVLLAHKNDSLNVDLGKFEPFFLEYLKETATTDIHTSSALGLSGKEGKSLFGHFSRLIMLKEPTHSDPLTTDFHGNYHNPQLMSQFFVSVYHFSCICKIDFPNEYEKYFESPRSKLATYNSGNHELETGYRAMGTLKPSVKFLEEIGKEHPETETSTYAQESYDKILRDKIIKKHAEILNSERTSFLGIFRKTEVDFDLLKTVSSIKEYVENNPKSRTARAFNLVTQESNHSSETHTPPRK